MHKFEIVWKAPKSGPGKDQLSFLFPEAIITVDNAFERALGLIELLVGLLLDFYIKIIEKWWWKELLLWEPFPSTSLSGLALLL